MSKTSRNDDPLLYDAELPLSGTYHPLGFTVEIATNSREVLLGAEESWNHFHKRFAQPPMEVRIGILKGKSTKCPRPPQVRGQGSLVTRVADAENFTASDVSKGFSFGWLTETTAMNRAYLRYYFLEGTFWTMAAPLYLTPIHGACVSHHGSGVLLCGNSGAGKSSLAYACARSGWTFLCDDSSHLVRGREGRAVIGNPYQMRFRPSATELFPELRGHRVSPRITGKLSIELVTANCPGIATTFESHVNFIVFLSRQAGPLRLTRCPKENVQSWFEESISYGTPIVRAAQRASLQSLLSAEIFELNYSDLDAAVAQLESMVQAGGSCPAEYAVAGGSRWND